MRHDEHDIQSAIVAWFDLRYAKEKYDLIASANGEERPLTPVKNKHGEWIKIPLVAKRLRAEGVRRGVPDLFLAMPMPIIYCSEIDNFKWICGSGYHGLWLEIKIPKGRLTPEQEAFMERQSARGYCCRVARSVDEGIKIIENYLDGKQI